MEEPGKIVSDDDVKETAEVTLEEQDDGEKEDDEGQEVIKVYILKADSGDDDLGESTLGMGVIVKSKHWSLACASVCQCSHSVSPGFFVISHAYLICCLGGTVDIGDADIDVDETVELMDPSALSDKMVLMPVGEANQNQEDISELYHADFCFHVQSLIH